MNRFARALRQDPTDAERHLWNHLRARRLNGFKFRRQRPFGPYVLGFVCLEARVAVELDGSQHVEQMAYDEERDAFIRSYGLRILRFWNGDVLHQTQTVLETICAALHRKDVDGRYGRRFPPPAGKPA
jgi:adenine-specific DNA-methyltransferase